MTDVAEYAGDIVRLTTAIVGVMNAPEIVTGEVSASGKTIAVEEPHTDNTLRLDTATIMAGDREIRDARSYQLYTYDAIEASQRANRAPGAQAGCNDIDDPDDLPEPTHDPVGA